MVMFEIEDSIIHLVSIIDDKFNGLVKKTTTEYKTNPRNQITLAEIQKLRDIANNNWTKLHDLAGTVQTHLANAAENYCFVQTILEYRIAIPQIGASERREMRKDSFEGSYEEANNIYKAIRELLLRYLKWWRKIESLVSASRRLIPLELKSSKTAFRRPATMLTGHKRQQAVLRKGEKVFAIKNRYDEDRWMVEAIGGEVISDLPAVCLELCPPDLQAMESALMLRLDLLACWTTALRDAGECLMAYIGTVLRYWKKIDIFNYKHDYRRKVNMLESLRTIESLLETYWGGSPQFLQLQNRISALRADVECQGEEEEIKEETQVDRNCVFIDVSPRVLNELECHNSSGISLSEIFATQRRTVSILVNKYKELHRYWNVYKHVVDNSTELALLNEIRNSGPGNADEPIERLLSALSADDHLGWSKYLDTITEKFVLRDQNIDYSWDTREPVLHVLPRPLELASRTEIHNYRKGSKNSQLEITVPEGKTIQFLSSKIPKNSVDINHYFTSSLLPKSRHQKSKSPCIFDSTKSDYGLVTCRTVPKRTKLPSSALSCFSDAGIFSSSTSSTTNMIPDYQISLRRHHSIETVVPSRDARCQETNLSPLSKARPLSAGQYVATKESKNASCLKRSNTSPMTRSLIKSRSSTLSTDDPDSLTLSKYKDRIPSAYLILNLPREDRIVTIFDKRQQKHLSVDQAKQAGLVDDDLIEFLDTETNTKYYFNAAIGQGIIILAPTSDTIPLNKLELLQNENYVRSVYKVDGVLDPDVMEWISLKEAVYKNIVNVRNGMLRIGRTEFCQIVKALKGENIKCRKLFHCNIRSLPPEMTVEIYKI